MLCYFIHSKPVKNKINVITPNVFFKHQPINISHNGTS